MDKHKLDFRKEDDFLCALEYLKDLCLAYGPEFKIDYETALELMQEGKYRYIEDIPEDAFLKIIEQSLIEGAE